ncbi:hypothetical protein CW304_10720 [Bacillus sp. UFRGS-B20]|nr:hypothetical protein CW304_10720 [Bacillus sp. UFRGS-B20]
MYPFISKMDYLRDTFWSLFNTYPRNAYSILLTVKLLYFDLVIATGYITMKKFGSILIFFGDFSCSTG